jgi:CheY-like chemotaxis protein
MMQVLAMLLRNRAQPVILIVEDYADTRQMLKLLLEEVNYAVWTAASGEAALSIAARNPIDLILTDFNLPDITGATLIRRLRQMGQDLERVPIVMLTALDADEYRHLAAEAGCNEFIVKPIDFDTLERVLDRLLQESRVVKRSPVLISGNRLSLRKLIGDEAV